MKKIVIALSAAVLLGLTAACSLPGLGSNAPPAQARSFTVHVTGKKADLTLLKAYDGDTITLTVYADKSEEVHLHGYDLHFLPTPDKPATKTFKADKTGTFEYEIEDFSQHLGNLEVDPR